jgi:hypothetical protein
MEPESMAVDSGGNLYIADFVNGVIRKVNTAGIITTIAGVTTNGLPSSGDGGPAAKAVLQDLHGVAVDKAGNIYVVDSPYLRKGRLLRRQKSLTLSDETKRIAWKAQQRLHKRYTTLTARGKHKNQVMTALARELLGFLWAIAVGAEAQLKSKAA